eukprot:CAMPEP_0173401958 /NCGR_PEP_ID=MMETSP1356-20130122/52562_1 /TAXON_ID=77927 ORGANISM="Hemiselmis virescens, Strain PCC157" /NCGR_SAMPLE_ID=MMETSP1356 /ASSEMBLY_ACC=CAM_ASM_000847 /LENGTH=314 /DNA_ID=CAMNT_0014362215 /DNA_START=515 /DNA_END=1462 /DNA_ORIENTATION=+
MAVGNSDKNLGMSPLCISRQPLPGAALVLVNEEGELGVQDGEEGVELVRCNEREVKLALSARPLLKRKLGAPVRWLGQPSSHVILQRDAKHMPIAAFAGTGRERWGDGFCVPPLGAVKHNRKMDASESRFLSYVTLHGTLHDASTPSRSSPAQNLVGSPAQTTRVTLGLALLELPAVALMPGASTLGSAIADREAGCTAPPAWPRGSRRPRVPSWYLDESVTHPAAQAPPLGVQLVRQPTALIQGEKDEDRDHGDKATAEPGIRPPPNHRRGCLHGLECSSSSPDPTITLPYSSPMPPPRGLTAPLPGDQPWSE